MNDPRIDNNAEDISEEVPGFQQADWDEITSGILTQEEISIEELEEGEVDNELPNEDDDNPYMDSDEALPDDEEERAIRRGLLDDN